MLKYKFNCILECELISTLFHWLCDKVRHFLWALDFSLIQYYTFYCSYVRGLYMTSLIWEVISERSLVQNLCWIFAPTETEWLPFNSS